MKKTKSILSLFLVFNLIFILCPFGVLAEEVETQQQESSVSAENDSYDEIYNESLAIADLYKTMGIDANTLVKILNLTDKPEGFYSEPYVEPDANGVASYLENADIQPFEPMDTSQIIPYDGSAYDGNPPYTEAEQQQRLEYIKGVFDREYSADRYKPIQGKYLAYLYTSHYIENINFDRTKPASQNFDPVFANIIGASDIEAFNTFFNNQQNAAVLGSFTSIGSLFTSIESSGFAKATIAEYVKIYKKNLNDEMQKMLKDFHDMGIVDATTIKDICRQITQIYLANYDSAGSEEHLISLINEQLNNAGLSGMISKHYVNTMKIAISSAVGSTVVAPVVGGVLILFDQLSSTMSTTGLGGLYYSYPTRKQLRLAIYYGVSQRP